MRKRVNYNLYNIGSNIQTARKHADITQEKLSEKIGVTPQYLSDLERGLVGASVPTLISICDSLDVSADYILFGGSSTADDTILALFEKIQRLPRYKAEKVAAAVKELIDIMEMGPEEKSGEE